MGLGVVKREVEVVGRVVAKADIGLGVPVAVVAGGGVVVWAASGLARPSDKIVAVI
jgi:hypothetical protein